MTGGGPTGSGVGEVGAIPRRSDGGGAWAGLARTGAAKAFVRNKAVTRTARVAPKIQALRLRPIPLKSPLPRSPMSSLDLKLRSGLVERIGSRCRPESNPRRPVVRFG